METASPFSLTGPMASMLTNLLPPRLVDQDGQLEDAFNSTGMQLEVDRYATREDVERLLCDPKVISFLEQFHGRNRQLYEHHHGQKILLIGILFLTRGKSVNPEHYDGWIKNRLRTFKWV
jgi:hypothetical protein